MDVNCSLFDLLEDDFDEIFERISAPRRRRVIRARPNYLEIVDDVDFKARFRLTKAAVVHVLSLIEDKIKTSTERNLALSPMNRLLLTLRYFATGSFLITVGDFSGVSKASASRIVRIVSEEIAKLRPTFVKFASNMEPVMQGFFEIAKFPRVIGAIDCTHISIKSPGGKNAEYYRNRKGNFSINVQAVVDSELRILDVVARWPGSCHDQTVFNNSFIKQRLLNYEFDNNVILGDRGYENTNYLLTPLHNPLSLAEHRYNESHIRTRNVVERCFGVWKSRFPVLSKKITIHLSRVQAIIVACAVLHNVAVDMGDEHFENVTMPLTEEEDITVTSVIINNQNNVRNNLISHYFSSL